MPIRMNNQNRFVIIDTGGLFDFVLQLKTIQNMGLYFLKTVKMTDINNCEQEINTYRGFFSTQDNNLEKVEIQAYQFWGIHTGFDDNQQQDLPHSLNEIRNEPEYIGLNILKKYNIALDVGGRRIQFFDKNDVSEQVKDWKKIPFYITENGIEIDVIKDHQKKRAILDTGASVSLAFEHTDAKPLKKNKEKSFLLSHGLVFQTSCYAVQTPLNNFADYLFGIDFFKAYLLFFDFGTQTLYLKPNEKGKVT